MGGWDAIGDPPDLCGDKTTHYGQSRCMEERRRPNRIAELRTAAKLTQEELAAEIGTTANQLRKLESGERRLTHDWMKRIAAGLPGREPGDLIAEGVQLGADGVKPPIPRPVALPASPDGIEYGGRLYVPLPVYDLRVSAGPGAMNVEYPEPVHYQLASVEMLRGVTHAAFDMLLLVRISGDSMFPTLQNGDLILVERTNHGIGRDGLYVFAVNYDVQVKRVSRDPRDKSLTISSDNQAYPTWTGVSDEDVHVLGRVISLQRDLGG